jgi:hypothetical protein
MVYSNKEHILQDKHWWDRLVKDPWNNWDKVTDFIKETMQQGVETFRGHTQEGDKVFMRIAQFDKYEIEVRYRVVGDEIKNITTAMVRLAKGIK